jgi:hypothetical protein
VVDTIDHEIKHNYCWNPVACDLGEKGLPLATHAYSQLAVIATQALYELFILDEYLQGEQAEIRVQSGSC